MFLPTWRPSTKAVVRPNYNGNQGSSRGVEDEVVVNFLPMSPKLLRIYPNREKDRGIVMAPLFLWLVWPRWPIGIVPNAFKSLLKIDFFTNIWLFCLFLFYLPFATENKWYFGFDEGKNVTYSKSITICDWRSLYKWINAFLVISELNLEKFWEVFITAVKNSQQRMRQIWVAARTHDGCCITLIQNKYSILIYQINDLPRLTIPECPVGNILFPPIYILLGRYKITQ